MGALSGGQIFLIVLGSLAVLATSGYFVYLIAKGRLTIKGISLGGLTLELVQDIKVTREQAQEDKRTYTEKLESAEGAEVFKYLLLIHTAALDGYVAQTRLQAEQSFRLARYIAVMGFALLVVGVAVGIYSGLVEKGGLPAAYIASVSGAVTEFISGVFFYLYNQTLQQLNRFHDRLVSSQHIAVSFLANDLVSDAQLRDKQKGELAGSLLLRTAEGMIGEVSSKTRSKTRRPDR